MKNQIKKWREFGLSSVAVNNRKTVYLIITLFLIGGISAYNSLKELKKLTLLLFKILE